MKTCLAPGRGLGFVLGFALAAALPVRSADLVGSLALPEVAFGGQIASWLELPAPQPDGMPDDLEPVSGRERASARLTLDWEAVSFSLGASASLRREGGRPELGVDEALLTAAPADFLAFRLGRFRLDESAALLLGVADFLCPQDVETLLSGDAEEASMPEDLVSATLLAGDLSLRLVYAPFVPPSVVPDPGSPWFPDGILPRSLRIIGNTHTIRDVTVAEPDEGPFSLDPAYLVSLDYSGDRGDLGASFFTGPDRAAPWSSSVLLESLILPGDYDAELFQRVSRIWAAALSGSLILGDWRFAAESAYANGKVADTTELDEEGSVYQWRYLTDELDGLSGVLSVSWSPSGLPVRAVAELRHARYFHAATGSHLPELGNAAASAFSWSMPFADALLEALVLASLQDGSVAATLRGILPFGSDAELSVLVPLFFGDEESELGRYGQRPVATVTLKARF